MSLINDALKRARQNQNPSPAPHIPGPPPGGSESTDSDSEKRGGLFGTVGLISVVIIALGLLWVSTRSGSNEPSTVHARTQDVAAVPEKPSVPVNAPAPAAPSVAPALAAPTPAASSTSAVANARSAVLPPVDAPPPLRLQAVVFNPRRPSAIINGRTLFIGDRVEEMRVVSITADSATLVGAGRTNRLRLAQ